MAIQMSQNISLNCICNDIVLIEFLSNWAEILYASSSSLRQHVYKFSAQLDDLVTTYKPSNSPKSFVSGHVFTLTSQNFFKLHPIQLIVFASLRSVYAHIILLLQLQSRTWMFSYKLALFEAYFETSMFFSSFNPLFWCFKTR